MINPKRKFNIVDKVKIEFIGSVIDIENFKNPAKYMGNSIKSDLNMPRGSEVIYTNLIWFGIYEKGKQSLECVYENIQLSTPTNTFLIKAEKCNIREIEIDENRILYLKKLDINKYIDDIGAGTYYLNRSYSNVMFNHIKSEGFVMAVVHKNECFCMKNVTFFDLWDDEEYINIVLNNFESLNLNSKENGVKLCAINFLKSNSFIDMEIGINEKNLFKINNDCDDQIDDEENYSVCIEEKEISKFLFSGQEEIFFRGRQKDRIAKLLFLAIELKEEEANVKLCINCDKEFVENNDELNISIKIKNESLFEINHMILCIRVPKELQLKKTNNEALNIRENEMFIKIDELSFLQSEGFDFIFKFFTGEKIGKIEIVYTLQYEFKQIKKSNFIKKKEIKSDFIYFFNNNLSITKAVNKKIVKLDELLKYSLVIENNDEFEICNIVVKDFIPSEMDILNISVNNQKVDKDIFVDGISFERMIPKQKNIIYYDAVLNEYPKDNNFFTYADISANVFLSETVNLKKRSNILTIDIENPSLMLVKSIANFNLNLNDITSSTTIMINDGSIPIENIILKENIPSNFSIKEKTFSIDGENVYFDQDMTTDGYPIGTLNPGQSKTVSFDVYMSSISTEEISECMYSIVAGFYKYDGDVYDKEIIVKESNKIKIESINPTIDINIFRNKEIIRNGDTVSYSIQICNNSKLNIKDMDLKYTLNKDQSIIADTVKINQRYVLDNNVENGLSIGHLGAENTKVVSFDLRFDTNKDTISNMFIVDYTYELDKLNTLFTKKSDEVIVKIGNPQLDIKQSVNKKVILKNEKIIYSNIICNKGNMNITNLCFEICKNKSLKLLKNTLKVDKVNTILEDNIVKIDVLYPKQEIIISYECEVEDDRKTFYIKTKNNVKAQINISEDDIYDIQEQSNEISVICQNIDVEFVKSIEKINNYNNIIEYKLYIKNKSTTDLKQIVLKDAISLNADLIDDSFKMSYGNKFALRKTPNLRDALKSGIMIGDLEKNMEMTIVFDAKLTRINDFEINKAIICGELESEEGVVSTSIYSDNVII